MSIDVSSLEAKVAQVVAFCQRLREENRVLRDRLAGLEEEKQTLAERMTTARERLEAMMDRLPAE
jgi:cell division protein ZapB